jgi:hypothetical protein
MVARHRVRTVLTPLSVRRAILEEAADKPEAVRVRSLRRRLTPLDRALTDREAEAIERLTGCIHRLSNQGTINYSQPGMRTSPYSRLPFSEGRQKEIAAMSYVLRGLTPLQKSVAFELTILLDPCHSQPSVSLTSTFIELARDVSGTVAMLYSDWDSEGRRRTKN